MKKGATVIISCHNYGIFLKDSISSILSQTVKPKKIIIIDDASSDSSHKIILKYRNKNPKLIVYIRNKKNLGTIASYNRGLRKVKTEYYCILDADDQYEKTFLEKTIKIMDTDQKTAIVYTDFELIGPRAQSVYLGIDENKFVTKGGTYIVRFPDYDKELLRKKNYIHNASLIRTKAAKQVGMYKKSRKFELDHYLFLRIINKGWKAVHLDKSLLKYRQHSITQTGAKHYLNENFDYPELHNKSKKELVVENILLEKKILTLQKKLNRITNAKFYKLWQAYCNLRDRLIK